ncbi:Uncharacterised protein [Mycobacteroides abscessus subsp. abscessus]|nr:Uncharacterised protein [Mycobacteroides abscessus subsp. abscessus]
MQRVPIIASRAKSEETEGQKATCRRRTISPTTSAPSPNGLPDNRIRLPWATWKKVPAN